MKRPPLEFAFWSRPARKEVLDLLEKDVEAHLRKPIKALGGLCLKLTTPGYTGVPDRLILLPGGIVRFVETKKPGKKERARQVLVHGILRSMGFTVYSTVDTLEKVKSICEDCRRLVQNEV